jgi:hypothetical protein
LLAFSFLVYPIAAALTMERMHSGRSINGAISWLLTAMLGAQWLWQRRGPWRKLFLFTACAGALEIALYMHDYFGAYQGRNPQALQSELTEALQYCFAHLETNQTLYISASTYTPYGAVVGTDLKPQLYAYVLFFGRIDPPIYQRTGLPKERVRLYDGQVSKPGLLLLCNNYYLLTDHGSRLQATPDRPPMPPNARSLVYIPFTGKYAIASARYLIFEIP